MFKNYHTVVLISHASKIMLKILQARFQQYVNQKLPNVQAGFRQGRGPRDQTANIHWIIEKAKEFQKIIYFCFTDYTKEFVSVDHNKLWEILKEMEIPDHIIHLLINLYVVRNQYVGQEAIIRTLYGTTDWFKIWKGVRHACLFSPCLFNFHIEDIMQNAGLDKSQAGIKIAGRETSLLAQQ